MINLKHLLSIILFLTLCKTVFATENEYVNDSVEEDKVVYEVGDIGPAGGLIFLTPKSEGNRTGMYFEASPDIDTTSFTWQSPCKYKGNGEYNCKKIGGTGEDIGTGKKNTEDIIKWVNGDSNIRTAQAAQHCVGLEIGEKNDWFLPSRDELNQMLQKTPIIFGVTTHPYMSSSELGRDNVWVLGPHRDNDCIYKFGALKNESYYVKCIRTF